MAAQHILDEVTDGPGEDLRAEEKDALVAKGLASDGVSAFEMITARLSEIRSFHSDICSGLETFADLVGHASSGEEELEALETSILEVREALDALISGSGERSEGHHYRMAHSYLRGIQTNGRALKVLATLTRTSAASLGVNTLNRYLTDLTIIAETISGSASRVSEFVRRLAEREQQTKASCRTAAGALQTLTPRLEERRATLADLGDREADVARSIGQRARSLSTHGKSHLKNFITAMQFSDRLAQRLDHFASMLEFEDGHVMRLAAAQARGMQRDLDEVIRNVRHTMAALAEIGRDGAGLFTDGDIAEAISANVAKRSETVDIVLAEYAKVQSALEILQADAAFAAKTAKQAEESFKTLEDSSKGVAIASINSMLLSARLGNTRGPLSVLSSEVRGTATKCLAAVGGSQASLNAITRAARDTQGGLEASSGSLGNAVADLEGLTEQSAKRLAEIESLSTRSATSAEGLLGLVDGVEAALNGASAIGERLVAMADYLDARPVQGPPEPAMLAAIWDSYTMDEERVVHAECFAGNPELERNEPPVEDASDDIDDLLF